MRMSTGREMRESMMVVGARAYLYSFIVLTVLFDRILTPYVLSIRHRAEKVVLVEVDMMGTDYQLWRRFECVAVNNLSQRPALIPSFASVRRQSLD